ncbi:DEAD/DEAH box helicase [Streptomyces shenzhenensis]|uniref:DEAD/DEAH box helicase n=1 Tax=Streptomyces shenzhenensis TaxID=943815 RepID=UPI0033FAF4F9
MTLPVALSGTDVIGQAKTGTGKTLGFGLPLLERVTVPADVEAGRAAPEALTDAPQALVVVPTRELCTQVTNDLLTAGKVRNVRVTAIYGGRAYEPQVEALRQGVDVVVGTPGRLLDLAGQKKLNLKHVKCLVLDEADEMLDLGFLPDVEKIIDMLPAKRQTMLFSATMPGAVIGLARRYMSQPTHIRATAPDDEGATVANIKQFVYRAHSMDKPEMIARILQADGRALAMIFCRTKRTAADIAEQLQRRGFASGAVHGDLGQGAREQALRAFRNGKVDVLVCTDVAARGIDVEGVTHVINYQSPEDEKTYLHRIGRTGRAGAKGTAITFVDWDDIPRWQLINKALELTFNDPVETYSTSPHLFADLGIPEGTKGVLPRSERTRAGLAAEVLEDLGETGGRGARGRGGRGGRGESRPAEPTEQERPTRTPRRRRRTRGGAPLDSAPAGSGATPVDSGAPAAEAVTAEESTASRTPRRRRRTRGGAIAEPVAVTTVAEPAEAEPARTAESALTTAEGPATVEAPERQPRRRRTRKAAEQATAPAETTAEAVVEPVAAAPAPEAATAVAEPEPETEAKPRRTRKTATAAETVLDTAEATEAKPKARRTRKAAAAPVTAEPAEGTAEDAEATVAAAPRRRTRKTATAAETAVDTAEATETKPKRTRKTAAAAEAPAETAEAEAKPKRTRKTAATAEAAVDTAEGTEAKPKRTRKAAAATVAVDAPEATAEAKPRRTRKTAAAAETAVDTAEGTEAKPKRTRKAAVAAADAAEGAEAKPKRTRKATAAVDTANGAEAEPKVRRTRKAAAAEPVTAEIPAQATEEPEVKPRRRTRKATAAADPVGTEATDAAAEPKPRARRTRKTAATAETPES